MRIERSIDVHTTPAKAYKVLSDPTNIPRYVPDVEDVVITRITPRLIGTKMRMRTSAQGEVDAEVTEACVGKNCSFLADNGHRISWDIHGSGGAITLVNTFETTEALDEQGLVTELERKLRLLRNTFQMR